MASATRSGSDATESARLGRRGVAGGDTRCDTDTRWTGSRRQPGDGTTR